MIYLQFQVAMSWLWPVESKVSRLRQTAATQTPNLTQAQCCSLRCHLPQPGISPHQQPFLRGIESQGSVEMVLRGVPCCSWLVVCCQGSERDGQETSVGVRPGRSGVTSPGPEAAPTVHTESRTGRWQMPSHQSEPSVMTRSEPSVMTPDPN
jgi:hypothetical protein